MNLAFDRTAHDAPAAGDDARGDLAREIAAGLAAPGAFISPKFFYDTLGSRLFEAITALPEYYPTRIEKGLLSRHGAAIAKAAGAGVTLIDLGAGNCEKARILLGELSPAQYVAVDISAEFLQGALTALRRDFPDVSILGVGTDISSELVLPPAVCEDRRLFAYLGSSIGNFTPEDASSLLGRIRQQLRGGGGLLIGVDLVKPERVLHEAYNDALGVTAAFNLNILMHANALIGSDFDVRDWRHCAFFDAAHSRIEMHLEAKRGLRVRWPEGTREFAQGQRIHTENSYKYRPQDFRAMLERAGFSRVEAWTDDRQWFALYYAAI